MNKTTENVVLGALVVGLLAAVTILTGGSDFRYAPESKADSDESDDIREMIKTKFRHAARNIDEEYREDVFVGIFNRNCDYIEANASVEDQQELYDFNEEMYNLYL